MSHMYYEYVHLLENSGRGNFIIFGYYKKKKKIFQNVFLFAQKFYKLSHSTRIHRINNFSITWYLANL